MVSGILLLRLFSDKSTALMFFNLPTSVGRLPVNEFCDKLRRTDKEETLKICGGIAPLSLLSEMSNYCRFWQFARSGGIFPSNLLFPRYSWNI